MKKLDYGMHDRAQKVLNRERLTNTAFAAALLVSTAAILVSLVSAGCARDVANVPDDSLYSQDYSAADASADGWCLCDNL